MIQTVRILGQFHFKHSWVWDLHELNLPWTTSFNSNFSNPFVGNRGRHVGVLSVLSINLFRDVLLDDSTDQFHWTIWVKIISRNIKFLLSCLISLFYLKIRNFSTRGKGACTRGKRQTYTGLNAGHPSEKRGCWTTQQLHLLNYSKLRLCKEVILMLTRYSVLFIIMGDYSLG